MPVAGTEAPGVGTHPFVSSEPDAGSASQRLEFLSGNEMAAMAARDIGFNVMGYYPITPSTEVAENLARMQADGEHEIVMIPGDGEHGAAGICYGASLGGGRVLNVTSSQGLLFSLEQLPVQSGTRFPMVLNIATRTVSGPLDIRGDHSDIYYALNTGWIILLARDPQAVYDLNVVAVKVGEHPDVRLPVIVAYDGFFTSHQKRRVHVLEDAAVLREFLGDPKPPVTALDPRHPVTIGAYMNDPDLINNKRQLSLAMEAARRVLPEALKGYGELTGRTYPLVDGYRTDDADAVLVILNSAAETAKEAVDSMREQGLSVGVVSPNVLRPFPGREIRELLASARAVTIADRADSYGANGGNLALEVRAALQQSGEPQPLTMARIYGLGGKDFYEEDAAELLKETLAAATNEKAPVAFDYHGATPGDPSHGAHPGLPAIDVAQVSRGMAKVTRDPKTKLLDVELEPVWAMPAVESRVAPGHGACPGCGIFPMLRQIFDVMEGDLVVLFQTGCAMVVTTGYPATAHRINYIHNLFQNGAATLSGLVEMYAELKRRGQLPDSPDITFVMVTGDGGMDIGMGPALGTANRNHRMIILEYDNQGYMNTGSQLSYSTPLGHRTSTSEVGTARHGKTFHHKDTAQIFAACHIPYVFTACEGFPEDLMKKAAKAQWYARHEGMVYGKVFAYCPLNWRSADDEAQPILQSAVDSCFFPLYEVERGHTRLTYDPEELDRRVPVSDWLKLMGKTRHLVREQGEDELDAIEAETERRWLRLKAMHQNPLL